MRTDRSVVNGGKLSEDHWYTLPNSDESVSDVVVCGPGAVTIDPISV